jgi:hypothetical protein
MLTAVIERLGAPIDQVDIYLRPTWLSVLFYVVPGWDGLRIRERQHCDADEREDRQAHRDLYQAIVGQRYISATIGVAQFRPKM